MGQTADITEDDIIEDDINEERIRKTIEEHGLSNGIAKLLEKAGAIKLLGCMLHGCEEAKNYILVPVLADKGSEEHDFELILRKRGRELPTEAASLLMWAKADRVRDETAAAISRKSHSSTR